MEREHLTKVVIGFVMYDDKGIDAKKFLDYCNARYIYLGQKERGMCDYYAVAEMDIPEEFSITKGDSPHWWVLTGSRGAFAYVEFGERAESRIKLYQEGVLCKRSQSVAR